MTPRRQTRQGRGLQRGGGLAMRKLKIHIEGIKVEQAKEWRMCEAFTESANRKWGFIGTGNGSNQSLLGKMA